MIVVADVAADIATNSRLRFRQSYTFTVRGIQLVCVRHVCLNAR